MHEQFLLSLNCVTTSKFMPRLPIDGHTVIQHNYQIKQQQNKCCPTNIYNLHQHQSTVIVCQCTTSGRMSKHMLCVRTSAIDSTAKVVYQSLTTKVEMGESTLNCFMYSSGIILYDMSTEFQRLILQYLTPPLKYH